MRLVDADALHAKICEDSENNYGASVNIAQVLLYIEIAPTIKTEPMRHGWWNYRHEDDWCYCTACGTDAEGSCGECLETDYCPHCGARMDGGEIEV